jgi:polysaccharide export outer membrane protein
MLVALGMLFATPACTRQRMVIASLPAPEQSTVLGPGDLFEVTVFGEKELSREYQVQPDGTINFPQLDRLQVAGLEPQQIEDLVTRMLIERKYLLAPQVTLVVKQYNSKKVRVVGAVQKQGNVNWTEGMKLVDAVSAAGGLLPIADGNHVRITRVASTGNTVSVTVSLDDITDGKLADILLQAGDTIKVDQRVW